MSIATDDEWECLRCGRTFTKGERRYGSVPYEGHYCREHDGKDD